MKCHMSACPGNIKVLILVTRVSIFVDFYKKTPSSISASKVCCERCQISALPLWFTNFWIHHVCRKMLTRIPLTARISDPSPNQKHFEIRKKKEFSPYVLPCIFNFIFVVDGYHCKHIALNFPSKM